MSKIQIKPKNPQIKYSDPLAKGLMSVHPISERGGSLTRDFSKNRYNATLTNSPLWKQSKFGSYLEFIAASSQYLLSSTYGNFGSKLSDPYSIAILLRTTSVANTVLIGNINTGTNTLWQLIINAAPDGTTDAGKIIIQIRNDGSTANFRAGTTNDTVPAFNDGEFRMIIVSVRPATPAMEIYIDGVSQPITISLGQVITSTSDFTNPMVLMGRNNRGTPDAFATGDCAFFALWRRSLTQKDAQMLTNNPWRIFKKSLIQRQFRVGL